MAIDIRATPILTGEPEKDTVLLKDWCDIFKRKVQQELESYRLKATAQDKKISELETTISAQADKITDTEEQLSSLLVAQASMVVEASVEAQEGLPEITETAIEVADEQSNMETTTTAE